MIKYAVLPNTYKLCVSCDKPEHIVSAFPEWTEGKDIPTHKLSVHPVCPKNSRASFQIAVSANEPYAINIGKCDFFSQRGNILRIRAEAECEESVKLHVEDMQTGDNGNRYADALLNCPIIEADAEQTTNIYVEISVPKNAEAGDKVCKIRLYTSKMFESEKCEAEIDIEYTVYNYVRPDVSENKLYLDLWQHLSNIARKHEVEPFSDEHFKILESYVKSLGELGQKAVTIVVSEIPWSGQKCFNFYEKTKGNLFEYSIIKIVRNEDGSFSYDYSAMQRYIDLCEKYSINSEISLYGLANIWCSEEDGFGKLAPDYPDGIRLRYLDKADGCFKYIKSADEIDKYIAALEQYFIKTGQIELVRVAADEPADIEAYRTTLAHIHSVAPAFKFKAAINHAEFIPEFGDEVYDFVPSIQSLCSQYDKICEYKSSMKGKRFLYYVCCGPDYPNTFLRSSLCETLFLGVFASYSGLDGFLRWSYTVWNDNPRKDMRYGDWPAGDTHFVYPSAEGTVMLSLRYKALAEAIEIYELICKMKSLGLKNEVMKAYSFVVKEKDIKKYYDEDLPLDEICSTTDSDYSDMKNYILNILSDNEK